MLISFSWKKDFFIALLTKVNPTPMEEGKKYKRQTL
jgi:hypothetical protein